MVTEVFSGMILGWHRSNRSFDTPNNTIPFIPSVNTSYKKRCVLPLPYIYASIFLPSTDFSNYFFLGAVTSTGIGCGGTFLE